MQAGFEPPKLPPMDGGGDFLGAAAEPPPAHPTHQQQQQPIMAAGGGDANIIPPSMLSLSRRQKAKRGELAQIDSAYSSVHALEIVSNLIQDACSYMETFSDELSTKQQQGKDGGVAVDGTKPLQLPCDCLKLAIEGLDQHASIISQAIVNSSDTKEIKYAQEKLMKTQKQNYAQQNSGAMQRDPKTALTSSLHYAREALDGIFQKTNPDFIDPTRAKKKRKKMSVEEQPRQEGAAEGVSDKKQKESIKGEGSESKENIKVIDLPRPMEGKRLYSPLETASYISNMIENNPGRLYLRAYKDKMMAEKLVPIRMSQLNSLVAQYGGPDKPVAPLNWNERGATEISWKSLLTQFEDKQNRGMSWSMQDTQDALIAARSCGPLTKKQNNNAPQWEDVEKHHSALMLLHKQKNHINEQIRLQEQRLKEMPPKIPKRKHNNNLQPSAKKKVRFDKNDKRYKGINLPPPSVGNLVYTPSETVANIMNYITSTPTPNRTDVRVYKEKIIAEKLVPISISQLNYLVQTHGGPDKPPAPKSWNMKGREEIISIDDLAKKVSDSPTVWSIDDTLNTVWAEKRTKLTKDGIDPETVKQPDVKTVNAYHTALLSIPSIAHRVVKPEIVKLKPGPKPWTKLKTPPGSGNIPPPV